MENNNYMQKYSILENVRTYIRAIVKLSTYKD